MRIKTLSIGLGLDLKALGADVEAAARRLASLADAAPPVRLGAEAQGAAMGDELTDAVDRAAVRMATAFRPALAMPGLGQLAGMADRVAGTIVTGFRRIDNEISFPKVQATLKTISDSLVNTSLAPVARGAAREGARAAKVIRDATARAWNAGPVVRYWQDFERRGKEALAKVRAREAVPRGRGTIGVGRRIQVEGTVVSKADRDLAARYERAVHAAGAYRKSLLAVGLAARATGTVLKGAFLIAADYARAVISPVTLITGGYIKLRSAIARVELPLTRIRDVASKGFAALFGGAERSGVALRAASGSARMLGASVRAATAPVGMLTTSFKGLAFQVAAAFGFVGLIYQAVKFITDGVKAASDLNESVEATKQVFGESFGPVAQTIDTISKRFGILRGVQYDAASAFGSIAKGAGATEAQAADLAITFTNLAADFASFRNLSVEDAAQKLRSGLAGETEPLRQFGVVLLDDAVKAKALAMGLGTVSKSGRSTKATFTELEKVQARAALIMEKLRDAQGDLVRTQDSAANQFRRAGGGVAEFGTRIGQLLLPAIQAGTSAFNEFMAVVLDFTERSAATLTSWVTRVAEVFAAIGVIIRNYDLYWEMSKLRVQEFVINAGRWLATLPANLANFGTWLGSEWLNLLSDAFNGAIALITNLGKNFADLGAALAAWLANPTGGFNFSFTPLLDGFKATTAQLPDLIRPELYSVQDEIDKLMGQVVEREAARIQGFAAPVAAAADKAAAPAAEMEKKAEPEVKLATAAEIGSKEAYSAIARSQAEGRGAERKLGEVAKNTRDGNGILKRIDDKLGNLGGAAAVVPIGTA